MPIYKTSDGKYYDVRQDQVESFLARNSGAIESSFDEMEKEGKRAAIYDFQGRVGVDEEKIASVPVEAKLRQQAQADAESLSIAKKARAKSNVERMQEGLSVDPMTDNSKQMQIDSEWNEYYNNKIASNLQQERENLISQGKQKNNFFIIEQVSRLEDDQVKNAWVDENGQLQVGDKINPKSEPENINDWASSVYDSSPQGPSWTEFVNEKKEGELEKIQETFNIQEETASAYSKGFIDKEELEQFNDGSDKHYNFNIWSWNWESGNEDKNDPYKVYSGYNTETGIGGNVINNGYVKDEDTINETRQQWITHEADVWRKEDIESVLTDMRNPKNAAYFKALYDIDLNTATDDEKIKLATDITGNLNAEKVTSMYVSQEFDQLTIAKNKYLDLLETKGPDDFETKSAKLMYDIKWQAVIGQGGGAGVGGKLYNEETEAFLNQNYKNNPENKQILEDAKEGKTDIEQLKEQRNTMLYEIYALNRAYTQGGVYRRISGFDLGDLLFETGERDSRGYFMKDGIDEDFTFEEDLIRMAEPGLPGERLPYRLSFLPDKDEFTELYNNKLAKFLTLTKAIEYNYDPATMEETGWFDTAGAAFLNKMYGERNVVTANKEVKNWEGVMTDLGYNIPDELKERAEDRWVDMVSGGMTDFALMIAVMALTKRPIAGAMKRLFGGQKYMLGRAFAKESLALEGTPMAQLAAKNIVIAESKALSWGIETLAAVGIEIGAGSIYNSIDKSMGGHGMPLSIMAGFGFMNPQMKYLMNSKLLAPIMKGDAKGLISMKQLPALMLKGGARQVVQAGGGTAVALAVELFDAAVIQGNLDAETFGEITDLEKASVLFTQMMLTGYFNHAINVPPMYREFGRNLMNEIRGYSGSTEVVNIAKKYKIKNKNATENDLRVAEEKAYKEVQEKYPDDFDPVTGGELIETQAAIEIDAIRNDFKKLNSDLQVRATQKLIELQQDGKNTFNQYQQKSKELVLQYADQLNNNPQAKIEFSEEQINFIDKVPETMIEQALIENTNLTPAEANSFSKAIKQKYQAMSIDADNAGFKRGTEQRKELFELQQEATNLEETISDIKKNGEQFTKALTLNQAERRLTEIKERLPELEVENLAYNETRRLEDIEASKDIYAEYISKRDGISLDKAKKIVQDKYQTFETTEQFQAAAKEAGVKAEGATGFFLDGDGRIFIDLQRAREVNKITIGTHEVLHALLDPYFRDPAILSRLVKDFKKQLTYDELVAVQMKMDQQAQNAEKEFFNALNDAIGDGSINWSPKKNASYLNIGNSISNLINRHTPFKKAKFKNGKDVYNFIGSYTEGKLEFVPKEAKAAEKVEMAASKDIMSPRVKEIQDRAIAKVKEWKAAEGEKKAELLAELKEINAEKEKALKEEAIEADPNKMTKEEQVAEDAFYSNKRKQILADKKIKNPKETAELNIEVDKLVGGRKVDGSYKMTYDQWTKGDRNMPGGGIQKAYEALDSGLFDGLIESKRLSDGADNLTYGYSKKEFHEAAKNKITDELVKFNPEKNNSLSGYLNPRIKWRTGDVGLDFKKAPKMKSTDIVAGESGSVKEAGYEQGIEKGIDAKREVGDKRSTGKKAARLTKEQEAFVMKKTIKEVEKNLPDILNKDLQLFKRKLKGGKSGERVYEKIAAEIKPQIEKNIPKSGGPKNPNPDYRKWLENEAATEILKMNKENPELLRNKKFGKILQEKIGKLTYAESVRMPAEDSPTNPSSQRAKYKALEPQKKEIADFIINKASRPNEGRLAVINMLSQSIAKQALPTAVEKVITGKIKELKKEIKELQDKQDKLRTSEEKKKLIKPITNKKKSLEKLKTYKAVAEVAEALNIDPTVSFSQDVTRKIHKRVVSKLGKENLRAITEKLKSIKKYDALQIYANGIVEFIDKASKDLAIDKVNVNSLVDEVFGTAGIEGVALKTIKERWGLVLRQAPKVDIKGERLTKEQYESLLEESFYQQDVLENLSGKGLLGYEEYADIRMKVKGLEQASRNTIRDAWESGKIKSEKELVEFALQRYKNALASSGDKIFDGSVTRSKSDVNELIPTGKKGNNRYSIFKNKSDLLEVLVKPVLGEKVYNEVIEIKKSETGREGDVYVNGEKAVVKNYAQSTAAIERWLPLMEGLKPGEKISTKAAKNFEQSKENAAMYQEIVISEAKSLIKQLKQGEVNIQDVGSWLESIVGDMTAPLRSSYPVDTFIVGKSKKSSDYRYEHNPPVRTLQIELARFIKGEITEAQLRAEFKDASAGVIPKYVDDIVNMKYKESKPLEYVNRFDRYLNKFTYGMFKEPIMVFENGKIKLIGEYQANAYAEVQKAIKANLEVQPSFSRDIPRNAAAQVENSASFDKALANARKRNQPIKKARVFDFDDTLARTNSRVIYSKPNTTGKPSPQLKAIVLAGGPGSGKSSIVKGLGLEKQGYKIVNQDISLEWAKKLVGLPEAEANYDAVQRSVRSQMGALARKIAEKKLDQYTTQGKGVILDGTGASLKATRAKIEALKDQGYDVKMVYVETSKDIALERNRARKERSLKDFIVEKTWDSVNANKAEYAKEFGEDFFKVNTDNLKPGEVPAEFVQAVNERLNATERGKLEAGGFAELGDKLANEGAQFDFREFSKVIDGKEGPLLNVAKMINEAKGDRNMFVLTARPPEAAASIHEFLKSMGLDIPIENITGLADGAPAAKARWMVEKAAEGYNDFYFADDHIGNVRAVGEALKGLQVKSKVQRAKPKESEKQLTEDLNKELSKEAGKDVSFSFDTKRDLKWKKGKGEISGKTYEASTEVGGQQVNIRLTEIEKGSWELDFGVGTKDVASGVGKMGITGKGDAFRIFSVVGNGVTELINKKGLKEINFSAIQPSRARVYETFTKLWAKKLGWEFEADIYLYGNGSYTIKKPGYKSKKSKTILSKIKSKASFSLDTKRDLKWKQHKENDRTFISKFKIGDKKYEIILADASGRGNVEFAFARLVGKDRVFDMIGDGNAYEVVSIVTNGLVDLIKSNRIPIKEIVFSADRPSRAKVYERIAKMWANELGWEMKRYDDYSETGADFAISRQEWAQKLIDQKVDRRGFEMQASDPAPKDFETIEPFTLEEQAAVREVFESQQRYREVLDQVDVKSEVQKERAAFSKDVDREFNELLESSTGVEAYKEFSPAKAEVIGAKKGRRKFFIPPSAEDFLGLLYPTLGKGKTGEANMDWYNKHLFKPYSRATANLSTDRANLMTDFKALKKQLNVPKDLRKRTKSGFTNEQAVRVYLWNKTGKEIPGLSKTDLAELNKIIEKDPNLEAFANQILEITKGDGYSEPGRHWLSGTITTDLIDLLNTTKRNKYLAEWNENVKLIFSPKNLNKLEAIYGSKYREALENSLARMKAGKNRILGGNRLSNSVLNYINQGQGAIMFTNMRSALLQTISSVNYINWSFNNPYRAGKAFANQPQYWKDFFKLMNSDYLVDRRNGLKLNISENEIADAAKTSTNKAKAALNYIIEKGYLPTKFADSFAIASGGATFYRNRIKDLMKKFPNMELSKAEEIAFEEFRSVSEASQQSSDPGRISQQQASDIGRVMLQFVNTPMQYARLQKRSFQDLMNGRGSKKEHISKIIYYGVAQNIWFNFFQQGAFMLGFGDNTEEEWQKREFGIVNSMLDNILRGIGLAGMTVSVLKNTGIDIYERSKKDRPEYVDAWQELLGFSPSIKSKLQQFQGAGRIWDKNADEIFEKGFSLDNPAWRSLAKVVQGATALPLERLFQKADNLSAAFDGEHEAWQSVAMVLGWPEWQLLSQDAKDFNYAKENPSIYNKKQQEEILEKFGVPKWKIKEFKKEEDRVNEILRLQKKNKKYYKPKTTKEQIEKEKIYYDYDKVEQQKILIKHGMKYETIKKYYKTEEARVNAIINLEKKSGKKYKP